MRWRRLGRRLGGRLGLLGVVALGLAPGTFVRTPAPAPGDALLMVQVRRMAVDGAGERDWPAGLSLAGLWQLASDRPDFGGFSAMLPGGEGAIVLFSDLGGRLDLPRAALAGRPGEARVAGPLRLAQARIAPEIRQVFDIESAAGDPGQGPLWLAFEYHNAIQRLDPDGTIRLARPPQMAAWGANSGAEAMVRLADGRFLVLAERGGIGLVFSADPVLETQAGRAARAFPVERFGAYHPTDMAQMPDGRVLVLLRATRLQVPPFATMLAVGDPAAIREGEIWPLTRLVAFDEAPWRENYEGLMVEREADGALALWLVADDNLSAFQRSLVLKLRWEGQ